MIEKGQIKKKSYYMSKRHYESFQKPIKQQSMTKNNVAGKVCIEEG